jgi:hypothetical protein
MEFELNSTVIRSVCHEYPWKQSLNCLNKIIYKNCYQDSKLSRIEMDIVVCKMLVILRQAEMECLVALCCSLYVFFERNSKHDFCSPESGMHEMVFEWLEIYSFTQLLSIAFISSMSFVVCSKYTSSIFMLGTLFMVVVFSIVFYICWFVNGIAIVIRSPLYCSLMVGSFHTEYFIFVSIICYKTTFLLYSCCVLFSHIEQIDHV